MGVVERVTEIAQSVLGPLGLHLYDVELNSATLRVTVDTEGGVDLEQLAQATRALSRTLDEDDPVPGRYTLEVSSPGLERRLRTPEHFAGAVGEDVNVKLGPHVEGERRIRGRLTEADQARIVVQDVTGAAHTVQVADISRAVTVFEWGPAPKPGQPGAKKNENKPKTPGAPAPAGQSKAERRAGAR